MRTTHVVAPRILAWPRLAMAAAVALTLLAGIAAPTGVRATPAAPRMGARTAPATPLLFEQNLGQAGQGIAFVARAHGYRLAISPTGMAISMSSGPTRHLVFVGANAKARVEGLDRRPGVVNYIVGKDARRWHTGVPTYARLRIRNLYAGVDLLYYEGHRGLEYDLVVQPGANPGHIRLAALEGVLKLSARGDLTWHTASGTLLLAAPKVYQDNARSRVAGGYRLGVDGAVSFRLARYDARRLLIIDPYIKAFGNAGFGSYGGVGQGIAVDRAGNTYVTGTATGPFPTTRGVVLPTLPGEQSEQSYMLVMKLNPAGVVVFSTFLGGALGPSNLGTAAGSAPGMGSTGIAVDGAGAIYLTGSTDGTYFPLVHPIRGVMPPRGGTATHAFVAKLNATGSKVLYSTYLGGSPRSGAVAIALDHAGAAYIAGYTDANQDPSAAQFPVTSSQHCSPGTDGFIAEINPAGTGVVHASCIGGAGATFATAIAVDTLGSVYVTGYTNVYPPKAPLLQVSGELGVNNVFVAKYGPRERALRYAAFLGGKGDNEAAGIAVDRAGDAVITGSTSAEDFPTTRGVVATQQHDPTAGLTAAFVSKLDPTGTKLVYSTYLSGNTNDVGTGIALDAHGDAFVTGTIAETLNQSLADNQISFPTTRGAEHRFHPGGDGFLTELNATGTKLISSAMLGGIGAKAVALGHNGHPYLTGSLTRQDPQDSAAKDIILMVYAL